MKTIKERLLDAVVGMFEAMAADAREQLLSADLDADAMLPRLEHLGVAYITQQEANEQGDERIARFYSQMIGEAKFALGGFAPTRDSWLDCLHAIHALSCTPLPEAVRE